MAVDSVSSKQPGASAAISSIVASRHLATHTGAAEATDFDSSTTCDAASEVAVRFGIVRLFINPSGRACAANSVIECLAWLMLLAGGFVYEQWRCGFELMRNVVSNNLIPLDLLRHDPFGWLLTGEWSIERCNKMLLNSVRIFSILPDRDFSIAAGIFVHLTQMAWTRCIWLMKKVPLFHQSKYFH